MLGGHVDGERAYERTQTTSVYLKEQNRVLRQRVRDQEATIERQADLIEDPEAQIDALRTTRAGREEQLETSTAPPDPSSTGF